MAIPLAGALLSLGASWVAEARVVAPHRGATPGARSAAAAQELRRGRVTSFDTRRNVLVVGGTAYRVDPLQTSFSDDRREPAEGGLAGLRAGDRVTVRGVRSNGLMLATQVVVHE